MMGKWASILVMVTVMSCLLLLLLEIMLYEIIG